MKRSCETCLWWLRKQGYGAIDKQGECSRTIPGTYPKQPVWPTTFASDFCAKWEPRDRSLVRCETCEHAVFTTNNEDGICLLNPPQVSANGAVYAQVWRRSRCSHWRLREERDDA